MIQNFSALLFLAKSGIQTGVGQDTLCCRSLEFIAEVIDSETDGTWTDSSTIEFVQVNFQC